MQHGLIVGRAATHMNRRMLWRVVAVCGQRKKATALCQKVSNYRQKPKKICGHSRALHEPHPVGDVPSIHWPRKEGTDGWVSSGIFIVKRRAALGGRDGVRSKRRRENATIARADCGGAGSSYCSRGRTDARPIEGMVEMWCLASLHTSYCAFFEEALHSNANSLTVCERLRLLKRLFEVLPYFISRPAMLP